jgi:hypothetical protein
MGARYYGLPGTPLKAVSEIAHDNRDSFYFIVKNNNFFDYSDVEAKLPGYAVSEVLGFFSDQPLGFDVATGFWSRVARLFGQTKTFSGWHFWSDIAMNPGYFILHMERSTKPGFDLSRAVTAAVSPSQSIRANAGAVQPVSGDFTAPDAGWYVICHSPIIRNKGSPVALSLASNGDSAGAPIGDFAGGYVGDIDARPFRLGNGETVRFGMFARTVQGLDISFVNHDAFAVCRVKALRSDTGFGRLY